MEKNMGALEILAKVYTWKSLSLCKHVRSKESFIESMKEVGKSNELCQLNKNIIENMVTMRIKEHKWFTN